MCNVQFVYKMHSMCFQSQFNTSLHFNYPVKEVFVNSNEQNRRRAIEHKI